MDRNGLFTTMVLLIIGLFIFSGCISMERASKETQSTELYMHLAFEQDIDRVTQAYRDALQNMNFNITHDEDGVIEAEADRRIMPAAVRIELSPSDTLQTDVLVRAERLSAAGDFTHYPYQLSGRAITFLDPQYRQTPYVYPQLIYPEGLNKCTTPPRNYDGDVVLPSEKEGSAKISERLTFTSEAIEAGTEGRLYADLVIDEKGEVTCAMIGAGLPHGLNENALSAILRTEFEPAHVDGEPVPIRTTLPLIFNLNR